MLVHLLRSHPQILCHGEVFERSRIGHLAGQLAGRRSADAGLESALWEQRRESPRLFLDRIVFDPQGRDAVGFKFKTDEAFKHPWRDIAEIISHDDRIKVIRLRRRDLIGQFVSHQVVLRQGAKTLLLAGEARPQLEPIAPRPGDVVDYVDDVLRREREADGAYRNHPQADLWYEELAEAAAHEQLALFLGVAPRPLTSTTTKGVADGRSLLLNLPAVVDALSRAGYPDGWWPKGGDSAAR